MFNISDVFPEKTYSYEDAVVKYAKGQFIQLSGKPVHYLKKGSGPPLVLIHGFLLHAVTWHRNIDALAKHFTVYALDLPGFGYSHPIELNGNFDFRMYENTIIDFMDALRIKKASLIGHSMGGGVAIRVAARHSRRIKRIVLSSPHAIPYEARIKPEAIRMLLNNDSLSDPKTIKMMLAATTFPRPKKITVEYAREVFRPFCIHNRDKIVIAGLKTGIDPIFVEDEARAWAALNKYALLIRGDNDGVIPPHAYQAFADLSDRFRQEIFENSGHTPHEECADRFNVMAIDFLKSGNGRKD